MHKLTNFAFSLSCMWKIAQLWSELFAHIGLRHKWVLKCWFSAVFFVRESRSYFPNGGSGNTLLTRRGFGMDTWRENHLLSLSGGGGSFIIKAEVPALRFQGVVLNSSGLLNEIFLLTKICIAVLQCKFLQLISPVGHCGRNQEIVLLQKYLPVLLPLQLRATAISTRDEDYLDN